MADMRCITIAALLSGTAADIVAAPWRGLLADACTRVGIPDLAADAASPQGRDALSWAASLSPAQRAAVLSELIEAVSDEPIVVVDADWNRGKRRIA